MNKLRFLMNSGSNIKREKEDFFDNKVKLLLSQRVKHYIYDVIRVFNVIGVTSTLL